MFIPILVGAVVVIVALALFISTRPADFQITRSATIAAPPGSVFSHVNILRNWEAWNPWGKLDPQCKITYDGPAAGVGASYAWNGNSKVGQGRNTIIESKAGEIVRLRLDFLKPMRSTNLAEFTFRLNGSQTLVTWTMSGRRNFVAKAFGLMMDFDQMIGGQFDLGLAQLKTLAEADSPTPAGNRE
jgi:hypothetical protein